MKETHKNTVCASRNSHVFLSHFWTESNYNFVSLKCAAARSIFKIKTVLFARLLLLPAR